MAKHKNCPNCGAPYDPLLNRCPYCGTAYFDMSTIDFDGREPFYLKMRVNGVFVTELVIPEAVSFETESEFAEFRGGLGNAVLSSAIIKSQFLTNLRLTGVPQANGTIETFAHDGGGKQ